MDKALGLIGIACRAGKVATGCELAESAVRSGDAALVIVAKDISQNGLKAIGDCCRHYGVEKITYSTKAELGKAVGRELRAVVAIKDAGLAAAIKERIAINRPQDEERKG